MGETLVFILWAVIKNIIFDWSGVIHDNRKIVYLVVLEILKQFGAPSISFAEFRREWEQPYMLFYRKFLPTLTIDEERRTYTHAYSVVAKNHHPKLYTGMGSFLRHVKHCGMCLIIISSDSAEHLRRGMSEFGLGGVFKEINADVHDKAINLVDTLKRNAFVADETIFIGDTTHEIMAGKSAGLLTGAVTWGIHDEAKLSSAQPDYIFHSIKELKRLVFAGQ